MKFDDVLKKYFDRVYTEVDFVKKTYSSLKDLGFNDDNTIAATCICRDEISQTLRSIIKHMWGEAFNLSSLAGMFFAGKTGLSAAMHHAPVEDGKERYVFYALPHIAIASDGKPGVCRREGREGASTACGALVAFQKEMAGGRLNLALDNEDVEQSLLKTRLLGEIPYGKVPDLIELTKITQTAIQADLERTLNKVVNKDRSNYAVITGIQIHGPENNYVWPAECYAIVNGKQIQLKVE
ncbi:MAG: low-co2 inducible protein lcib [Nitrospirae bacterium]|nr:MAG: low-co2 inducible protein lcib [Nitrospirota bacterium]